ncbi:MAG: hypothetical protein QF736_02790 [Candidatus Thalassarchaeaceae archaeon]|nr:hypothetical protein [Candidatus Thalassarchaeaceae archaeon]|tara:strand:- start:723 stop:2756 length:2034 start_codon:yes stop_codon:yes gene_type:complete
MSSKRTIATLLVSLLLLSGCLADEASEVPEIEDCIGDSCENENTTVEEEVPEEEISISGTNFCDNTNPDHCLLPFPSSAFLDPDSLTTTGYRLDIDGQAIPDSASAPSEDFHMLDYKDGHSPSTQIFTTFSSLPDISGLASQDSIHLSSLPDHNSLLLNMDTGQITEHWVEISSRTQEDEPILVHVRSLGGLDHNTQYAVAFRGLSDENGDPIEPFPGFKALRDGLVTDNQQIESLRPGYENMFTSLAEIGYERQDITSAWWFHTASTQSITGDIISMRNDATQRLGDHGIGCNVKSVIENYAEDNTTLRRISGTITTPHYLESTYPPTAMTRSENGTPEFNFLTEVVFTVTIPMSAAETSQPAPLVVLGHGFLGNGEGMVSGFRGWANDSGVATIGTDFKGWSSDGDFDAVTFGLMNVNYLQHQSERLQQSVINHLAMITTIKGVCSDIPEFYHNGVNLVDTTDIDYMGVSLGGIRGPSMLSLIPEIDRGVLWVAGSSFGFIAERSTQYTQFEDLFASPLAYESTMDRSILIALMQSMWDTTEPETYLPFIDGGMDGELHPYEVLYVVSINDAQVTTLSADRASRTSGIPVLSNSTYHPHGLEVVDAPVSGSAIVYFDGNFPAVPSGNIQGPMAYHSLAHNQVLGYGPAVDLATDFLLSSQITDTCSGKCYFEGTW